MIKNIIKILKKWTNNISNFIFDFLFKEKCAGCKKEEEILCENCIFSIKLPHLNPNEKIFSAFSYKDPIIRKILLNLKYYHKRNLGKKLGAILYNGMLEEISELKSFTGQKIILIPIPMTKARLKERGYNQASLIALGIYEACDENIFELREDILIKKYNTFPQAKIKDRTKRLKNIKGCFVCTQPKFIKNKTVIIIDDITTTGATLNEAIKILEKSGAKKAVGFVIAH